MLRFTAQLIDAIDGKHLWAERYDRELKDLFALQDEITEKILLALHIELTIGEQAKAWRQLSPDSEAYRALLEWRELAQTWSPDNMAEVERLATEVYRQNPDAILSNQMMGWSLWFGIIVGASKDPEADLAKAREFANRSLSLGEEAHTYLLQSVLDLLERDYEAAIAHADRAIEMLPNGGDTNAIGGSTKIQAGQPAEGVELMKKGMRYEPFYPGWVPGMLANGLMLLGQYEEAKEVSRGVLAYPYAEGGGHALAWARLAAIDMFEGNEEGARKSVMKALEVFPGMSISWFKIVWGTWKDQAFVEKFLDALRRAGLPENSPKPLPNKPSIAVLPFDNMSDDPKQTYFADGMAEDIITDLSNISGLFVIARNSSFSYRGKSTDVRTIGRELGVRYLLEGSVRREGSEVRINAQLVDTQTVRCGGHLWAKRYDGDVTDVFDLQDQITEQVVGALKVTLGQSERDRVERKPTDNPEAYSLYLQGRQIHRTYVRKRANEAFSLLEQAINLDPTFAEAYAELAGLAYIAWVADWAEVMPGPAALDKTKQALARAVALDPQNSYAAMLKAFLAMRHLQHDQAIELVNKAIALTPGIADRYLQGAMIFAWSGDHAAAAKATEMAAKLEPRPTPRQYMNFSFVWLLLREHQKALEAALTARRRGPDLVESWVSNILTVSYAHLGELEKAAAESKRPTRN